MKHCSTLILLLIYFTNLSAQIKCAQGDNNCFSNKVNALDKLTENNITLFQKWLDKKEIDSILTIIDEECKSKTGIKKIKQLLYKAHRKINFTPRFSQIDILGNFQESVTISKNIRYYTRKGVKCYDIELTFNYSNQPDLIKDIRIMP